MNAIETNTISEVAKDFDVFVEHCNNKINQPGHAFYRNIKSNNRFAEIKKVVAKQILEDAYFVKTYEESSHNQYQKKYLDYGYGKHNTKMLRKEVADNPVIADFTKNYLMLKHARVKINSQPPGHFFPSHIDFLAGWSKHYPDLAKKYRYPQFKRYLLFLEPKANGHFYSINNQYIDYEEGDIIEQYYYAWHATGNGDTINKTLIAFEGIKND